MSWEEIEDKIEMHDKTSGKLSLSFLIV